MGHAQAVADQVRFFDVVAVVEVLGGAVARVHAVQEDAGADVAKFGVGGACRAPVFAFARKGFDGRVKVEESVELGGVDGGELGFDPVFGVLRGCHCSWHEDCAFVVVVAGETHTIQHAAIAVDFTITYPYIPGTFTK